MVLERFRIRSSSDDLTAGARLDTLLFFGKKGARVSEARLERLYLTSKRDGLKITVGDFYKQMGRGIVLALRKVDEVGFDVVLRGGEVEAPLLHARPELELQRHELLGELEYAHKRALPRRARVGAQILRLVAHLARIK